MRLIFVLLTTSFSLLSAAETDTPFVDMLLVIAVDVSGSIEEPAQVRAADGSYNVIHEYSLQKEGLAEALLDKDVQDVLEQCNSYGIGITYVEWSGSKNGSNTVKQVLPWTHIKGKEGLRKFTQSLRLSERSSRGSTDIVKALRESHKIMKAAPFQAYRKVIDLSTDGKQNVWDENFYMNRPSELELQWEIMRERDAIIKDKIAINALVIMNESYESDTGLPLDAYHFDSTYGGPGSFLKSVSNFNDIKQAFKERFLRELNNCMM